MMNKKYYVMVLLPLFSLCAEATQKESFLGKSLPGETKKTATQKNALLQEYLCKDPSSITDIREARKIIKVLQRTVQKAHTKTAAPTGVGEKLVQKALVQKAHVGAAASRSDFLRGVMQNTESINRQANSKKPMTQRYIEDSNGSNGIPEGVKKIQDAMLIKLRERLQNRLVTNATHTQFEKVKSSQEFSLGSITNDANIAQAIQAIKNGNGNVNTLAELVREKIPQFDFRKNDYKVKDLIYSLLKELKQQGLMVEKLVEIYSAIMEEKLDSFTKKMIEKMINE
ncbi:MAG: hypothetical protein LBS71_01085 [Puniceicoccales bacterium]|nr:hypothetical protein [Puniceicoccales bacterium]